MNSEIMAFAFGAKCVGRGLRFSGRFSPGLAGSASRLSCPSRCARAKAPMPKAERVRNSRRVGLRRSVHMEELVGGEQLLAEIREGRQFGVRLVGRPELLDLTAQETVGESRLVLLERPLIRQPPRQLDAASADGVRVGGL